MKNYWEDKHREFGYYPLSEKWQKLVDDWDLLTLIDEYEASWDRKTGNINDRERYEATRMALWNRLGIASSRDIMCSIEQIRNHLQNQVFELRENFKRHRHDKSKNYTEKPVW